MGRERSAYCDLRSAICEKAGATMHDLRFKHVLPIWMGFGRKLKMEDGEWRMEDGRWKMENV